MLQIRNMIGNKLVSSVELATIITNNNKQYSHETRVFDPSGISLYQRYYEDQKKCLEGHIEVVERLQKGEAL